MRFRLPSTSVCLVQPRKGTGVSGLCSCSALSSLLSHDAVQGCRDTRSRWGPSHEPARMAAARPDYVYDPGSVELHLRHCERGQQLQTTRTWITPSRAPRQSYKRVPWGSQHRPESLEIHSYQTNPTCRAAHWPAHPNAQHLGFGVASLLGTSVPLTPNPPGSRAREVHVCPAFP